MQMNLKRIAMIMLVALMMPAAMAGEMEKTVFFPTTAGMVNPVGLSVTGAAAQVIGDVNAERMRYGLQPLRVDPELTAAARIRAGEIARKFSHTRPDGSKWSTVSPAAKGENIARGHHSAYRVMAAWMSSPGHRANILRQSFGSIGVCAIEVNGVMYWVQLFGR